MTDESAGHGWNHRQCWPCWLKKWGTTRTPNQVPHPDPPKAVCCCCGMETMSGIYIRVKPGHYSISHCPDIFSSANPDVFGLGAARRQALRADPTRHPDQFPSS